MRVLFPALALVALAVAGCGGGSAPVSGPGTPRSSPPEVRGLLPADLDADGQPDQVVAPNLRRLLLQGPAELEISVRRGNADLSATVTRVTTPGGTLHEVLLDSPPGAAPFTVQAGAYTLNVAPVPGGTAPSLLLRPGAGAVADDLVNARAALFESPDSVALVCSGAAPSVAGPGLALRCGEGAPIALRPVASARGLVLVPETPPLPGRAWRVVPEAGADDAWGRGLQPDFFVLVRRPRNNAAVRLCLCDLDRDAAPELAALYADGSVSAVRDPAGRAEALLPAGEGAAVDLCAGDFNGDGTQDLALLRVQDQGASLLVAVNESKAAWRCSVQVVALSLTHPVAAVAGDLDRDGRDDVAVLDAFGALELVLSSLGRRVLRLLPPGQPATALVTLDANADGRPDLFALSASGEGRLLLNGGAGSLAEAAGLVPLGAPGCQRAAAGELDGDRHSDLVLSGFGTSAMLVHGADQSETRLGLGEPAGSSAGAALVRDVNRDSRAELLLAREDARGLCGELALYVNAGQASALPTTVLPLGVNTNLNDLELWRDHVALATAAGLMLLKLNPGALPPTAELKVRFVEAYSPVPQIPAPLAAAVADFNDDGRADMAAIDRDGKLRVWLCGEPGEPFKPLGEPVDVGGPGQLKAIDFDRDRAPDLLFMPADATLRPRVLRNRRGQGFDTENDGLLPLPPTGLRGAPALGDFDRDGDLDALWPSPLGRVQINEGERGWRDLRAEIEVRDTQGMRLQFSGELCCADFTGDGLADVAAVMQAGDDGGPQSLVLLEGTGQEDNPFRPVISAAIRGRIFDLTPADFNADGRLDLALGFGTPGQDARLTLLQLDAGRQFAPFDGSPSAKGRLLDLALDDLDRDGDLDLMVSEEVEGAVALTLWANTGTGAFADSGEAGTSLRRALGEFRATNLSLADFTGDGRSDLLAVDAEGNVVVVRTTLP